MKRDKSESGGPDAKAEGVTPSQSEPGPSNHSQDQPSKPSDNHVNCATEAIETTRTGEAIDFEGLYRDYRGKVFGTACRMLNNTADAEDITQDVFVKVFKKLGSFRGESQVSTWIYRITVNACLDFLRQRKKRQTVLLDESMDVGVRGVGLGRLIPGLIPKMPAGYREVFVLHDIQGLKHCEIAEILGITDGASKSQLHRARAFLRRELAPIRDDIRWLKEV